MCLLFPPPPSLPSFLGYIYIYIHEKERRRRENTVYIYEGKKKKKKKKRQKEREIVCVCVFQPKSDLSVPSHMDHKKPYNKGYRYLIE